MARVTVEDCIEKIDNRFELVMLAAQRARAISTGAPITVDRDNDKNPVVALREIADNTLVPADEKEGFIKSLQKYVEVDEIDDSPDFGDDSDIDDDDPMLAHPVTVAASRSRIFESSGPPRNFDDQPFAAFGKFEDITGVDD